MKSRQAAATDAEALASLLSGLGYPASASDVQARLKMLTGPDHATFVVELEGEVVGFIGLCVLPIYESSRPIGYILALSVSEPSQRRGVGQALIRRAEEWFAGQDIFDVRVGSGLQREGAHSFYEKCGFEKTGYRFKKLLQQEASA